MGGMSDQPFVFEHPITVPAAAIDTLAHVNNVVYIQWVQDASAAHWLAAASPEMRGAYVWVVLRHEIDYLKPSFEGDALVARTWVGEDKGVRWERFVEVVRPRDGAVIIRARSQWCLLDRASMRPKRIDPAIRRCFVEAPVSARIP